MKPTHSDKVGTGTGLAAVAANALFAFVDGKAPGSVALVATAGALIVVVRVLWGVPLRQQRAERLLEIAKRNPGVPLVTLMFAHRLFPRDEELTGAVQKLLREIAEAVDPAVVEPLYRLAQARMNGRVVAWETSALADFIKPLNAEQIAGVRDVLRAALQKIEEEEDVASLTFLSWIESRSSRMLGAQAGEERIAIEDPRSHIFRVLRSSGVALETPSWSGPQAFVGDGTTGENADRCYVDRSMAAMLLELVD